MVTSVLNLQAVDPYHAVEESDNALNTINLKKLKEECINYLRSKLFFLPATNAVGGDKGLLLNNTSFPTLANELERIVHPTRYFWIDCRDLGTLHKRTLGVKLACIESDALQTDLLLLEGVDALSSESILLSTILKLVDQCECSCYIIATCRDETAVPNELTQPYRLGSVISCPLPTVDYRDEVFQVLLGDPRLKISSEDAADTIDDASNQLSPTTGTFPNHRLSWDLALRTQGLSEYDLTMLVKSEIEDSFLLNLFSETIAPQTTSLPSHSTSSPPLVQLSARKLLNASYCDLQPTSAELLTWPDDDVAGSHPVPVVLGLEDVRKQLLSWTIGCIPSQRKTADRSHSQSSSPLPQSQSQSSSLDSNALKSLFKIRPCSGIVISGPSSSGKTLLATWLAYETRSRFKFIAVSCADLVNKVVGETEKKISDIFKDARRVAPCFILLDNLEAVVGLLPAAVPVGGSSGSGSGSARYHNSRRTQHRAIDRMLSALLTEIDGVRESKDSQIDNAVVERPVIVIATTADRALLDRALLRPGRLELHIELSLPDRRQRSLLFIDFFHTRAPLEVPFMEVDSTGQIAVQSNLIVILHGVKQVPFASYMSTLVTATAGRSFADLKNAIQEALLTLMRSRTSTSVANILENGGVLNLLCSYLALAFNLAFFT